MAGRLLYNVLTEDELKYMKQRMEQLLIERGIHIDHDDILKEMGEAGCEVDMEARELKFTKEIIDKAVAAVPAEFTLYSPDGKHDLQFPHPEGDFYVRTNTGAPYYRTWDNEYHFILPEEVEEWYHLTNVLDNINYVCLPSTSGEVFPEQAVDVYTLEKALKNSAKHIWIQPYEADNVKHLINLSAAAAGGLDKLQEKPFVSFISCSVPCMSYKHMDAEILYQCAKNKMPVQPCALPTAGANTPCTAQGTAFLASAEVFAQIIILETLCPGLPVIATPLLFSMDMRSTYTLQSNTEITVSRLICMDLFERGYNIRCHSYGTGTDAIVVNDPQNYIERTSLIHAMAMSNASVLGGAGQLETALTLSPQQLIIDNEIFGIAHRIRRGLAVDDEILDFDEVLAGVDKDPSYSFLMSKHTRRHYKEAHQPDMFNRDSIVKWEAAGSKTLLDKATEKYHKIMEKENPYQLDPERAAAVETALKEAHADLVK